MSARKTMPFGAVFMILVIALALLGVGYALWSETLTISGSVETGEVDVEFSTYDPMECVDVNGVLTCPEPEEKAEAANCVVEWLGPNADSPGDEGSDLLQVTVTGMYPSYHCQVSFDVTSTGNVPVHVWLPEPTSEIPAWVATDFDCYEEGVQLHQGESTGVCTMDIHFTNDQAPLENSGPHIFGWTILATQYNEDPVCEISFVETGASYPGLFGSTVTPVTVTKTNCSEVEALHIWTSQSYSGTGWAGWSCLEAGFPHVVGGGVTPDGSGVTGQGPAYPGAPPVVGYSYPDYPHYDFPPGEEGWVAQAAPTAPTGLYVLCAP